MPTPKNSLPSDSFPAAKARRPLRVGDKVRICGNGWPAWRSRNPRRGKKPRFFYWDGLLAHITTDVFTVHEIRASGAIHASNAYTSYMHAFSWVRV